MHGYCDFKRYSPITGVEKCCFSTSSTDVDKRTGCETNWSVTFGFHTKNKVGLLLRAYPAIF